MNTFSNVPQVNAKTNCVSVRLAKDIQKIKNSRSIWKNESVSMIKFWNYLNQHLCTYKISKFFNSNFIKMCMITIITRCSSKHWNFMSSNVQICKNKLVQSRKAIKNYLCTEMINEITSALYCRNIGNEHSSIHLK